MRSPSASAQKWVNSMTNATTQMKEGVQAVTVSPMEKAAQNAQAYKDGVNRAVDSGKWQRGLRRVPLEQWKAAYIDKGIGRVSTGASQAKGKMENFLSKFLPHVEAGRRKLESMPRGTIEQNLARMNAMALHNHEFRMT